MIETIHIFDEFSQAAATITTEQRHKKRMALDPFIYGILQSKYGKLLQTFWQTHTVPKETDSYFVLVERRIHPNIEFVLQNAAYFGRHWGIILVCSDINLEYLKQICAPQKNTIHFLPWFQGNPDPHLGKTEYNHLLKQSEFYKSLPGEHHIFLKVDTYFRKAIPDAWKEYDLVAAPYEWDESSVGGGLSYRKKQSMIAICDSQDDTSIDEDAFLCQGAKALGMRLPLFELGLTYVSESCIYEDPIGVHQWWTFFFPNETDDADEIFHSLLSLEID
jgi:hypothetical protein